MTRKILLICLLFIAVTTARAQFAVKFVIDQRPGFQKDDPVFIAGNFNQWRPGDSVYMISEAGENLNMRFIMPAGNYEFKCTKGTWSKVECTREGKDIGNRIFKLNSDTVIHIEIDAWKDDFLPEANMHTASSRVRILDTAFFIPQLNRTRKIWLYLPEGYAASGKHYPVMYMHDGQNLFDQFTAGFGEWGVDECLDSLFRKNIPPCIVVGIENGPRRFNEYNPWDHERFGKGEGEAYAAFLAETLKPFIDKHFRTLPSKENTIVAGSSMGGLISFYAMLRYPEIFGKGGIFSPAFWSAPAIREYADSNASRQNGKLFFYMGGLEGGTYIADMKDIEKKMGELSSSMILSVIDDESSHNEQAWRKWFPEFYKWIMADGFNNIIRPGD